MPPRKPGVFKGSERFLCIGLVVVLLAMHLFYIQPTTSDALANGELMEFFIGVRRER